MLIKILRLLILACLFGFLGCKPKTKISNVNWYALSITSEDRTVINIWPNKDTVIVKVYNTGTIFYHPKKVTTETLQFVFTKSERDSLFMLANDIITTPQYANRYCTDFVGDLQLTVYYGQTTKRSINYSGVCNWNTLSDKTKRLHNILKAKMKNVYLGEHPGIP